MLLTSVCMFWMLQRCTQKITLNSLVTTPHDMCMTIRILTMELSSAHYLYFHSQNFLPHLFLHSFYCYKSVTIHPIIFSLTVLNLIMIEWIQNQLKSQLFPVGSILLYFLLAAIKICILAYDKFISHVLQPTGTLVKDLRVQRINKEWSRFKSHDGYGGL